MAHDRAVTEALADAAIAAGEAGTFAGAPEGDERPIFIVGMPRSGTTLVERILTSHPKVRSVGELSDFAILLKQALKTPGNLVLEPALLAAAAAAPDLSAVGNAYLARVGQLAGDTPHFIDKMPFNAFLRPRDPARAAGRTGDLPASLALRRAVRQLPPALRHRFQLLQLRL